MAGRGWHDKLSDGCGESVLPLQRVKTIQIAASSDMDDWKAVLGHVQKLLIIWLSLRKFTTIPKGRYGGGNYRPRRALVCFSRKCWLLILRFWRISFFNKDIEISFNLVKASFSPLQQRYRDVVERFKTWLLLRKYNLVKLSKFRRGNLRVQFKLYSYWFRPWHYLHNARFRGALRRRGVWRRLCKLGVLLSQAACRVSRVFWSTTISSAAWSLIWP